MAEQVWNLQDVFQGRSEDDIVKKLEEVVPKFKKLREELKGDVSAQRLKEMLQLKEEVRNLIGALSDYYGLLFCENTKDENALAKMKKYEQLGTNIGNDTMFFTLWLMHLEDEKAEEYMQTKELEEYAFYIEKVRILKKYTKSEEIEQIISLKSIAGGAFGDLYDILTNGFMFSFRGKKLTQEEVRRFIMEKDPSGRQEAYDALYVPYEKNVTLLSELYKNVVLEWCNEGLKIRGYKNSISIRNRMNSIEDEAVETMMEVVRKNAGMFVEYFKLKYEINKKNGAKYPFSRHHLYAPFELRSDKTYSYDEAKDIVLTAFKEFDVRFYDAAKKIFDANHVHSHPKEGKRSGAFCASSSTKVIPYILLNHAGSLRDVFTMMHEFGHGIHDIFCYKQTDLLYHPSLPMAETASVFGEMILADKMLSESKDRVEKMSLLVSHLDETWATVIRQTFFVLFEKMAHEKIREGATTQELDDLYYELLKEQFGDMEIGDVFKREWCVIPHIYHTPFYCYAYSWGKLLVLSLYGMYKEEGSDFIEKYIELLSTGGSKSPKDTLAPLGIDPKDASFWQKGFDVLKERIEELRKLSEEE